VRVLLFGGTRFIGRRLVKDLLEAGHQVTLYTRGRAPDDLGSRVERVIGDRRVAADLASALSRREFDAAYDFLSFDAADARLAIQTLGGRVGHFIHISTCSVYWCSGDFPCPVSEEELDRLGEFAEQAGSIEYDYGYNKRLAEKELFAAHRQTGFPVTTIRMPVVAGENDHTLRYASYCLRLSDGGPLILPDGGLAPFRHVYVGDVARALCLLAGSSRAIGQAYNLACSEILTVKATIAATGEILGRKAQTVEIPAPVLRQMGLGTAFSPFSRPAPLVPTIFKARRDLGWSPTPHAVWLERAVRSGLSEARAAAEPPLAYTYRAQEIDVIQRYRKGLVRLGEQDGTSSALPE